MIPDSEGSPRVTVDPGRYREIHSRTVFRALYGPGLASGEGDPVNYVQKGGIFVHGFPNRHDASDPGLSGLFPWVFLYNNRQYPGAKAGSDRVSVWPVERRSGFWDQGKGPEGDFASSRTPRDSISDGVEELRWSSSPPQGSVEPFGNPGPQMAPIAFRRGGSGELCAKRGYFRARFSKSA